jgi:pimeloyl-ACP methyl ester carboxylesterase
VTVRNLGGVPMNVVVSGDAQAPPVLLASGLGGAWFDWARCTGPLRAAGFRVIVFDRPGLGASPITRERPGLARAIDHTAAVAEWAGPAPILVAHSMAAFPAEALARLRPGLLGGLVLVDPSWERDAEVRLRLSGPLTPAARAAGALLDVTGLAGIAGPWLRRQALRRISRAPDVATEQQIRSVYGRGQVLARIALENQAYAEEAADLRALRQRHPFPDIPLTVITALGDLSTPRERREWADGHAELAALSPRGEQIELPDCPHQVQADRPDVIADVIAALR